MDALVFDIPVNTKVIIELPQGEFTGTIIGSGTQVKEQKCFVALDNPSIYPNLEVGAKAVIVPKSIVKIDVSKLET